MEKSWFYAFEGTRRGPVSRDDLKLALTRGEVDRQSLVWRQGMDEWLALEKVEELQPLLEHAPPPLPPQPPPLPPVAPEGPGDGGASEDRDRRSRPKDRSDAGRAGGRGSGSREISAGFGSALLHWLFSWQIALVLVFCGAGVAIYLWLLKPLPPEPAASGRIVIDANPWGEVRWIRGPGGAEVDLPGQPTTPLVMPLPAGAYQARVDYPHSGASGSCDLQVRPDETVTCWLELAPMTATSYLEKIGW